MPKVYYVEPVALELENKNLEEYLLKQILPRYEVLDAGHNQNHIWQVWKWASQLNEQLGHQVPNELLATAVFYHDLGTIEGRQNHEQRGADILQRDAKLGEFFSKSEIADLAEAVAQHRASFTGQRRTLLSKIVADADTMDSGNLPRLIAYYRHRAPEMNDEEIIRAIWPHAVEKLAPDTGYATYELPEAKEMITPWRQELWMVVTDEEQFVELVKRTCAVYLTTDEPKKV